MPILTKNQQEISKSISYFLRHKPEELGVEVDLEGWVNLNEFLDKISSKLEQALKLSDINEIIENSDKKRWEIDLTNNSIRATYGHSLEDINLGYPKLNDPITLYHGTPRANLESIKKDGLQSMSRNYIHTTPDEKLAIKTAKRISENVALIELNVLEILKDDIEIYKASDYVYLVQNLDRKYLIFT